MKKNILKSVIGIFLILGISFFSCEEPQFNPDKSTAEDNARAEGSIIDVFGFVSNNSEGGEKLLNTDTACYDIEFTIDSVAGTRTLVITFDEAGCTIDELVYKGKITTVFTGSWIKVGSSLVTTFTEFERDGVKLSGSISATYSQLDADGPLHTITSTNMVNTYSDGKTVSWSGTKTIKWLSGYFTHRNRSDDKLKIDGNLTGLNRAGESFTSISADLIKEPLCKLFVSGTVTITKGIDVIAINFGSGECDGEFSVTQNNQTVVVNP
jgi:hypothetical protein